MWMRLVKLLEQGGRLAKASISDKLETTCSFLFLNWRTMQRGCFLTDRGALTNTGVILLFGRVMLCAEHEFHHNQILGVVAWFASGQIRLSHGHPNW